MPRVGDLARRDVPTCRLDEPIVDVRERVRAVGWDICVVTNEQCIVLGLLRRKALEAAPETIAEQVMDPGPSTFRVNVSLEEMAHYVREHALHRALITTSDGRLVGMLRRDDLERALDENDIRPH